MEETRDLFKKIRATKRTFHTKMGTIKDRSGVDLTEAEDIKKWWQEQRRTIQKDLNDPDKMQSQVGLRKHQYKQS